MVLDGPLRGEGVGRLSAARRHRGAVGDPLVLGPPRRRTSRTTSSSRDRRTTPAFVGDLGNSCTFFAMQERPFPCGPGSDPYCPGSDLDYDGWAGSKLVVLLASMPYADDPSMQPLSCIARRRERARAGLARGSASRPPSSNRDGWSGYHPCHCFNNTDNGQLGDGCGQINVFEVIAEASGRAVGQPRHHQHRHSLVPGGVARRRDVRHSVVRDRSSSRPTPTSSTSTA